jgi:hypothetical protein
MAEPAMKRTRSKEGESEFTSTLAEMDDAKGQERRPPVPPFHPAKDDLVFQQMELDHYNGPRVEGMDGASSLLLMLVVGLACAISVSGARGCALTLRRGVGGKHPDHLHVRRHRSGQQRPVSTPLVCEGSLNSLLRAAGIDSVRDCLDV